MNNAYYRTGLIGGNTTDLDQIAYASLVEGDIGLVVIDNNIYHYYFDASSSAVESSPSVIDPDDSTGDGRWIYQSPTHIKKIIDKTNNAILTVNELASQYTITNNGATGEVILTWPTLVNGQEAIFYVEDAQYLQIKTTATTVIKINNTETTTEGYIRSNVVGNWVALKVINNAIVVIGSNGVWTYDK